MTVDVSTTLGELVTQDPRRARVLERFGLDYCCHGERSLVDAAGEGGLDPSEIAVALDLPPAADGAGTGALPKENAALAHDIVDTHHAYLWEEMPRLGALVAKVHSVHGERHPELEGVRAAYVEVVTALDPHMTTEERVVFPAISRLERTSTPTSGSLEGPISELRAEHDTVGDLFREIRSLTDGYAVPQDACNSYRAMLAGLEEMELDLHEHIHKENNILFPQVLELERRLSAGQATH